MITQISNTPRRVILHTRHLWVLSSILLLLLVGCGGSSLPSNYVATDQTHLATITWQQNGSDLTGTWKTWTMPGSTTTLPGLPQSVPFSGQLQGQTAMLTVGGSTLQATYTSGHLALVGTNENGQFQPIRWYPVSLVQSTQLTTAFSRYASLQGQLAALRESGTHPPMDSDPYTYVGMVQNAQTIIQTMQGRAAQLQSLGNPCGTGLLALFEAQTPDPSTFTLSSYEQADNTPAQNAQEIANHSQLAQQVQAVQEAWQQAHASPISSIAGVSLPWILTQADEAKAVQPGMSALSTLQTVLISDEQTMANLRRQAQTLEQQVKAQAQAYEC